MGFALRQCILEMEKTGYAKEHGRADEKGFIDCTSGINPFGVSGDIKAMLESIKVSSVNQYPAMSGELKGAIALYWKNVAELDPSQIILGDGSIEILYKVNKLLVEAGRTVLGFSPQFPDYINDVKVLGGCYECHVLKEERNYAFDADQYLEQMDRRHVLFYLDNPNNPTGQVIPPEDIRRIVKRAEELERVVVVDEAYHDFLRKETSAIGLVPDFLNLIVVRTFSKGMGLAGMRAGYLVTSPDIAGHYDKVSNPYGMNALARQLCLAALKDEAFLAGSAEKIQENKKRLMTSLGKFRVLATDPSIPIMTLMHPDPETDLAELLHRHGILAVSGTGFPGLGRNFVRLMLPAGIEDLVEALGRAEKAP